MAFFTMDPTYGPVYRGGVGTRTRPSSSASIAQVCLVIIAGDYNSSTSSAQGSTSSWPTPSTGTLYMYLGNIGFGYKSWVVGSKSPSDSGFDIYDYLYYTTARTSSFTCPASMSGQWSTFSYDTFGVTFTCIGSSSDAPQRLASLASVELPPGQAASQTSLQGVNLHGISGCTLPPSSSSPESTFWVELPAGIDLLHVAVQTNTTGAQSTALAIVEQSSQDALDASMCASGPGPAVTVNLPRCDIVAECPGWSSSKCLSMIWPEDCPASSLFLPGCSSVMAAGTLPNSGSSFMCDGQADTCTAESIGTAQSSNCDGRYVYRLLTDCDKKVGDYCLMQRPCPLGCSSSEGCSYLCSDGCQYKSDGACDDGGSGSEYSDCSLGTDCSDCGSRPPPSLTEPPPSLPDCGGTIAAGDSCKTSSLCGNTCNYAYDNDCDDGGPGSEYSECALGSDCHDCGARVGGQCTDVNDQSTFSVFERFDTPPAYAAISGQSVWLGGVTLVVSPGPPPLPSPPMLPSPSPPDPPPPPLPEYPSTEASPPTEPPPPPSMPSPQPPSPPPPYSPSPGRPPESPSLPPPPPPVPSAPLDAVIREVEKLQSTSFTPYVTGGTQYRRMDLQPGTYYIDTPLRVASSPQPTMLVGNVTTLGSVIIDGRGASQLFDIPAHANLILINITLAHGNGTDGGAVIVREGGALEIGEGSLIFASNASGSGGAVCVEGGGSLKAYNASSFIGNYAKKGGAIALSKNGHMDLRGVSFRENVAEMGGGIWIQPFHSSSSVSGADRSASENIRVARAAFSDNHANNGSDICIYTDPSPPPAGCEKHCDAVAGRVGGHQQRDEHRNRSGRRTAQIRDDAHDARMRHQPRHACMCRHKVRLL